MKKLIYKVKRKIHFIMSNMFFGEKGKHSKIIKPLRILGKNNMYIGNDVYILNGARIEVVNEWNQQKLNGKLIIGDGTSIEQGCHIIAADKLVIGENCVISAGVYISDCAHPCIPELNIMKSDLEIKKTSIGKHVFVGIGAKILPGVHIGNYSVVGAGAVVTKDIEDYCMVVGIPARVIKRYDTAQKKWIRI